MEQLKQKLLDDCNNSGLPLEAIYYLVKDLFRDVSDTYEQVLEKERAEKIQKMIPEGSNVEVEEVIEEE